MRTNSFRPERCSERGHVGRKKPLGHRSWTCIKCSAHHDRDVSAAKNLSGALADPNSRAWRPDRA
ncbi:zinc ribbon domain-containing protein [Salinibacter sp.]|uniref:zinc ribbon domain-containing protein n=1 Tax=Salinibacter sp. TaxID=2065818 RepID=UPI003D764A53